MPKTLESAIFEWVSSNPGCDVEDVARQFKIGLVHADTIVEGLLNQGLLDVIGSR